jgi:cytochrome c1
MITVARSVRAFVAVVGISVSVVACSRSEPATDQQIANSDSDRGRVAIERFGCGSCHDIPGVRGANGMVGPPLTHWSQRRIIAGEMENTPDHLITWITMPQAVEPGTAMPNMGVSDGEARDIAAYLYSIK